MKRNFILMFLVMFSSIFAAKFNLVSFKEVPRDFKAQMEPVVDDNQNYCSVIKVETDMIEDISLKQKTFKKEKLGNGSFYFYVSSTEQKITCKADGFEQFTFKVPASGLNSGSVYYLRLDTIKEVKLILNVSPNPDRIILNNQVFTTRNISILPGKYRLEIEKSGYENIDEEIVVGNQNSSFNYSLSKSQPSSIVASPSQEISEENTRNSENNSLILNRFGIIFEILSVEMFESTLTINMTITSTKDDRSLSLLHYYAKYYTRMFDNFGNEYQPNRLSLANNSKTGTVRNDIIQNIKTPATLIFNNVNRNISKVSLFDLGVETDNLNLFRVKFRDLQIKKID